MSRQCLPYIDEPVSGRHVEVRFLTGECDEAGDHLVVSVHGLTTREVEDRVRRAHPDWIPWGGTIGIPD